MSTSPPWVYEFFDQEYGKVFLDWPLEKRLEKARLIERLTNHHKAVFLDQCCGMGGLSHGLQQLGWRGFAVDLSQAYTTHAQEILGESVQVTCADAGKYRPSERVDVSINWHTSLGYGGLKGMHALLQALAAATKKGGAVVLELRNLLAYQQGDTTHTLSINTADTSKTITRVNRWEGNLLHQTWIDADKLSETFCYHPSQEELALWARDLDAHISFYAPDGGPFDPKQERMIAVAKL